jgi:hypothetical protein
VEERLPALSVLLLAFFASPASRLDVPFQFLDQTHSPQRRLLFVQVQVVWVVWGVSRLLLPFDASAAVRASLAADLLATHRNRQQQPVVVQSVAFAAAAAAVASEAVA